MPRRLSPNSEILILAFIGFVITVIEAMNLNLNENLCDAWKLTFPKELNSGSLENLVKSVVSGIIIIRGASVHVYLASYLLLIFPVLKEKGRVLLLVWLAVSGFRSIFVNVVATLIGVAICSCLPNPHPSCFKFLTTKGIELACSVFMWVVVNDFMFYLKKTHRNVEIPERTTIIKRTIFVSNDQIAERHNSSEPPSDSDIDSEGSIPSANDISIPSSEEGSSDSLIAKAAVNWFFRLSLGMNYHGRRADKDEELTQKFLQMSPEEIERLTEKIKLFLSMRCTKDGKFINIPSNEQTEYNSESKSESMLVSNSGEKIMYDRNKGSIKDSSIFRNKSVIMPNRMNFLSNVLNETKPVANTRNVACQTNELSKRTLKKIELLEREIQGKSYEMKNK